MQRQPCSSTWRDLNRPYCLEVYLFLPSVAQDTFDLEPRHSGAQRKGGGHLLWVSRALFDVNVMYLLDVKIVLAVYKRHSQRKCGVSGSLK